MSILTTDDPLFDYATFRFGRKNQDFRGPMPDLRAPYVICIGSTPTFGRFTNYPFSTLVEQDIGMPVVNFGADGVGPGFYAGDDDLLHIINGARLCIVEVMSARPMSNRMYSVRPKRNERLLQPSGLLRGLYPDVDFREFIGVQPMLKHLNEVDADRFRLVANEMQNAWIGRVQALLNAIEVPKILFWFAQRDPDEKPGIDGNQIAWKYPHYIDGPMIDTVMGSADRYVECVSSEGLPQDLTLDGKPILYRRQGRPLTVNRDLPSPEMHLRAADELRPAISRLLRG